VDVLVVGHSFTTAHELPVRLTPFQLAMQAVDLEPEQANLLEKVCSGPTISGDELRAAGALEVPAKPKPAKKKKKSVGPALFEH
jgi:hypothetical protein